MGLQTEITDFIGETADKWDEYILTDKAPLGMITQFELAKQILAKMREVVEGAALTDEEIERALAGLHDRGVVFCSKVILGYYKLAILKAMGEEGVKDE